MDVSAGFAGVEVAEYADVSTCYCAGLANMGSQQSLQVSSLSECHCKLWMCKKCTMEAVTAAEPWLTTNALLFGVLDQREKPISACHCLPLRAQGT